MSDATDWHAPNQQAVGVDPAAALAEHVDDGSGDDSANVESYDPGAHTVDEVKAYVEANESERAAVLEAEQGGRARSTLLDWLEAEPGV